MSKDAMQTRDVYQWYTKPEDVKLPAAGRELLETYSGLAPEEVLPHVLKVRDAGFALYPWPCIGWLRFLNLNLSTYDGYPEVLKKLTSDPSTRLLDVGACFGQDIRKLVVDGVKPSQLAMMDLFADFSELGKQLFRDGDKLDIELFVRDVQDDNADWAPLEKKFDILNVSSFLHIWGWEMQLKAAARLATFLKNQPGSFIIGSGVGSTVGNDRPNVEGTGMMFMQSQETMAKLWDEAGKLTGTKWTVESTFHPFNEEYRRIWDPNGGHLRFLAKLVI